MEKIQETQTTDKNYKNVWQANDMKNIKDMMLMLGDHIEKDMTESLNKISESANHTDAKVWEDANKKLMKNAPK